MAATSETLTYSTVSISNSGWKKTDRVKWVVTLKSDFYPQLRCLLSILTDLPNGGLSMQESALFVLFNTYNSYSCFHSIVPVNSLIVSTTNYELHILLQCINNWSDINK